MSRRGFLGAAAGAGATGLVIAARAKLAGASSSTAPRPARHDHSGHTGYSSHSAGAGGVDHAKNGFHPYNLLTGFDHGQLSKDRGGRPVREFHLQIESKTIEIAPGVRFEAWTYNGRVPGPSLRAREGDLVRIHFHNTSEMPHTIHFHGIHIDRMDGVPGMGQVKPGASYTYEFTAEPFGTHLYHCHTRPFAEHINRGLYGAFIIDPKQGRPEANEMVMVMNGFDIDGDERNEIYALNTVAFAYEHEPIQIKAGELQRAYVINVTEHDPVNSLHLHANFFDLYRTGTSLTPQEHTDIVTMGQAERHMLEFRYPHKGQYMFHAHQSRLADRGWSSMFEVI
jgi:manganese oxidase